jgi:modification methylase
VVKPRTGAPSTLSDLPTNVWLVGQAGVVAQRQGRYTDASVRGHPGKLLPEIARRLIEQYARPGDWVLDPMSGIGTTGVEAVHLGRHYLGVELEPRFVAWQQENLELAQSRGATGEAHVVQGDARKLTRDWLHERTGRAEVDAILTSPPYGNRLRPHSEQRSGLLHDLRLKSTHAIFAEGYGVGEENLGNLPDGAYLREIQPVYDGCFAVLKPGGILAVVIQPSRDRHRLRPLHHETVRLCRAMGFEFIDEVAAIHSRVELNSGGALRLWAHTLFLKRLAIARLREAGVPVTLTQVEYVLVFRKPDNRTTPPPKRPGNPAAGPAVSLQRQPVAA